MYAISTLLSVARKAIACTIRKILTVISEGQIDAEIYDTDEFLEFTQFAIMWIDATLTTMRGHHRQNPVSNSVM